MSPVLQTRGELLSSLLPPQAVCAELFRDLVDPEQVAEARLFPEEEQVVARAVDKRRREFTSVRVCARRALAGLGIGPVPVVPGERGAPRWPDGVVGSMTHCEGYRACAVARTEDLLTLGVDAEPMGPLPEGVLEAVTLPAERAMLLDLARTTPEIAWDRLLFSAKESVYKAWFPLTSRWLDFEDARITVLPDGSFTARLLVPGPIVNGLELQGFLGRWRVQAGMVVTAVSHPA